MRRPGVYVAVAAVVLAAGGAAVASADTPGTAVTAAGCLADGTLSGVSVTGTPTCDPSATPVQWGATAVLPATATATPSPTTATTTATPSPSVTCPDGDANTPGGPDPFGGCWPGPGNTGVPAGTALTQVPQQATSDAGWTWNAATGTLFITSCGVTLTGLQVNGDVAIRASNGTASADTPCATLADSLVNGTVEVSDTGRWPCLAATACGPLVITDTEISSGTTAGYPNIGFLNVFGTRLDIHGGEAGVHCDGACSLTDSWEHGGYMTGSFHYNSVGSNGTGDGPLLVEHNYMNCGDFTTGSPTSGAGCSDDLGLFGDFAVINNVTIDRSYFAPALSGPYQPAYCLNANNPKPGKTYPQATNETVTGNVFARGVTGKCGAYGVVSAWTAGNGNTWSGNTWDDGTPLNE